MCGIAGIVGDTPTESFLPAAERMAAAMLHRGPDSHGVIASGECLLVNTRLAILDCSERGRQPMANAAATVWITYNGETYNASELRKDLIQRGYSFRSTTDTEVVLHLYQEYGDRFVEKMRGMFALAIWDLRARKLLLARDRLGIKPLYIARQGKRLIFGSELKCLLASGLIDRRIDPQALRLYLQFGHVPSPGSMIDGVHPLQPGYLATWRDGAWDSRAYWTLDQHRCAAKNPSDAGEQLGDVLLEAMRRHLISDVPVVLFLSGGADSACLGALARKAGTANVTAMTIGFAERDFDETALSRQTAGALGLPLKSVILSADRVADEIDPCIRALDQPSVDGLNSYWISKVGAEQGFKVALSGQGADELFGGYSSWKWFERLERIGRWACHLPKAFAGLLDHESSSYRWRKLSYLVGASDPFLASQMAARTLFLESDVRRLLAPALGECREPAEAGEYLSFCASQMGRRDGREKLSFMDICAHLQPRLLRDLDAMSMAHSLEVRPVFLDDRVVEFVLSVPNYLHGRPKELLFRSVQRFMPGELLADLKSRGKRTFTFPFARWLARDLKPVLDEAFGAQRLKECGIFRPEAVNGIWQRFQVSPAAVGWSRVWNLFVVARWCEAMNVCP